MTDEQHALSRCLAASFRAFDDLRWIWGVETMMPAAYAARRIAQMGRSLAASNVAAEQWRARRAFASS